jgi:hypothetical protein
LVEKAGGGPLRNWQKEDKMNIAVLAASPYRDQGRARLKKQWRQWRSSQRRQNFDRLLTPGRSENNCNGRFV